LGEIFINRFEKLLEIANKENIPVVIKTFKSNSKGLCNGIKIGINEKIHTNSERASILAEELGHYYLTVGDIRDQSIENNRRQEKKARNWAYLNTINIVDIINAYKTGVRNIYEMAEYLEVSEEFLNESITVLGEKYGLYYTIDKYTIYFNPFGIYETTDFKLV
jgi:hypothetical protein